MNRRSLEFGERYVDSLNWGTHHKRQASTERPGHVYRQMSTSSRGSRSRIHDLIHQLLHRRPQRERY